jgi:hypothetical protein
MFLRGDQVGLEHVIVTQRTSWKTNETAVNKMKRRTEITIEIDRVMVISRRNTAQHWCESCGAEVDMISESEATIVAGATAQAIRRLAQTGAIHSRRAVDGGQLICLDSLLRAQSPDKVIETSLVLTPQNTCSSD